MNAIQLDFFKSDEECEIDCLRKEVSALRLSQDKVRKKLFSENGSLKKDVLDLKERIAILERFICRGEK